MQGETMNNIFSTIPNTLPTELFDDLVKTETVRIERILSKGHRSPDVGWYDQPENEWVMVLEGYGVIEYEDGSAITLHKGDYVTIPAHQKHRVAATADDEVTVWLAVFYSM